MLRALLLLLLCLAAPAAAQPAPPAQPATVRVTLRTSLGDVVLELERARAPVTTANFLRYVDARRFDGTSFYRSMKLRSDWGLVQGGIRDPRLLYPPIAHEPTTQTGLSHGAGVISMPRRAPGSAQADFFITVGAHPGYDANPAGAGDNLGFAAFGRVVQGMDVVLRILEAPTSPTLGEGVMRGQMLEPQVRIITARRTTQ
ncbi:MAG TPA: peptidylprolyl isomerase [Allosphingosinicella sp.]|nr:peptidylprolyl isomerase [Allosphingosinicella sp.]